MPGTSCKPITGPVNRVNPVLAYPVLDLPVASTSHLAKLNPALPNISGLLMMEMFELRAEDAARLQVGHSALSGGCSWSTSAA